MKVRHPSLLELMTVPALFLLANGAEWRAHKSLLHRRTFPFQTLYDQHTPRHHALFQYDTMEIHSKRELYLVLIPSMGVLTIVIATVPFSFLFARLFSPNSGWLLLVASAIYVVTYELTHLSYHWPSDTRIGRMKLVRIMREHHRRHHHPKLMHWNYNVSFPLFDWIKGSIAPQELVDQVLREKSAPRKSADRTASL
jgi:sterol desaturase/sphingolipid hydroxylase (fatty acid hydroxylase superfamily)